MIEPNDPLKHEPLGGTDVYADTVVDDRVTKLELELARMTAQRDHERHARQRLEVECLESLAELRAFCEVLFSRDSDPLLSKTFLATVVLSRDRGYDKSTATEAAIAEKVGQTKRVIGPRLKRLVDLGVLHREMVRRKDPATGKLTTPYLYRATDSLLEICCAYLRALPSGDEAGERERNICALNGNHLRPYIDVIRGGLDQDEDSTVPWEQRNAEIQASPFEYILDRDPAPLGQPRIAPDAESDGVWHLEWSEKMDVGPFHHTINDVINYYNDTHSHEKVEEEFPEAVAALGHTSLFAIGDPFEIYVRARGISKSRAIAEVGRQMRAEAKAELEQAARERRNPADWVCKMTSRGGWARYDARRRHAGPACLDIHEARRIVERARARLSAMDEQSHGRNLPTYADPVLLKSGVATYLHLVAPEVLEQTMEILAPLELARWQREEIARLLVTYPVEVVLEHARHLPGLYASMRSYWNEDDEYEEDWEDLYFDHEFEMLEHVVRDAIQEGRSETAG